MNYGRHLKHASFEVIAGHKKLFDITLTVNKCYYRVHCSHPEGQVHKKIILPLCALTSRHPVDYSWHPENDGVVEFQFSKILPGKS